nr:retrovirus-related Pol polyprotein from transposon TNT 1-94 [Tanacetum cinerariifolium]
MAWNSDCMSFLLEYVFETYKNVTQEIRDQLNAEAEAVQIILTGIDNDIYSTVDACPNACEMWKAIERLKQGESINVQDLETNLFWELGKFTSLDGESLESYYSRMAEVCDSREAKGLSKIDETHALSKPVTANSVPRPQESKVVKNDNDVNSDSNGLSSIGLDNTAKTRRLQPWSNTKNDKVSSASKSSCSKNKEVEVEEHHRNLLLSKNKKHMSSKCNNVKLAIRIDKSKVVCAMIKQCLITANHDVCALNYVNDMNSHGKKHKENVSNTENQKKQKPKRLLLRATLKTAPSFTIDLTKRHTSPNGRTLDISFLHVFGALCYPKNDREDIGKLGAKVQNPRFKACSRQITSGLDLTYAQSTITTQQPTEGELDLLFEAMYDDHIGGQPSAAPRTVLAAQEPQGLQTPTATTTIAYTTPTPTNSSSLGFINIDHPSHVYKLKKAHYGLKQAPRAWYDELSMFLLQNHFFNGTIDPTLFIRRFNNDLLVEYGFELTEFLDADYAGCKDTFKGTFGEAQFLREKLVTWSSKKQDCTATLTAKAEYVSLSTCCAQVIWMRTQLTDYGYHFNKIPIFYDSKSAIAISCNPVQHSRTKQIDVRYHFIKEHVEKGTIKLYFVKTDYQLADLFTKALLLDRFNYLVRRLGMRSLSPTELERLAKSRMENMTLGDKRIGINTSVLEEKATAYNIMCCYADKLKEGFFPRIDQVALTLLDIANIYKAAL